MIDNEKIGKFKPLCENIDKVTSENRGAVKGLLAGLGYKSAQYIKLTTAELETVLRAIKTGDLYPCDILPGILGAHLAYKSHVAPEASDSDSKLAMIKSMLGGADAGMSEEDVIELIKLHAPRAVPTTIECTYKDVKRTVEGLHHAMVPEIIKRLSLRLNVMLVGPAGSGKTTAGKQIAAAMGLDYFYTGQIQDEYRLTGFLNATGQYMETDFYKFCKSGGLFFFDELDKSGRAATCFNAAIENGFFDFPNGRTELHENCHFMAGCNTFGQGGSRMYSGSEVVDGSLTDRFITVSFGYDDQLERALASNDEWVTEVQGYRAAAEKHKIRIIIGQRASIQGARMLAAGISKKDVLAEAVFKGADVDTIKKLKEG